MPRGTVWESANIANNRELNNLVSSRLEWFC